MGLIALFYFGSFFNSFFALSRFLWLCEFLWVFLSV